MSRDATDSDDMDWPGSDDWICDGCNEPKPTDECWPCETDDGRQILCPDCRDEMGVEPIKMADGGERLGDEDEDIRRTIYIGWVVAILTLVLTIISFIRNGGSLVDYVAFVAAVITILFAEVWATKFHGGQA